MELTRETEGAIGAPTEISTLWLNAVRERGAISTFGRGVAQHVVTTVLSLLEAGLQGQPVGPTEVQNALGERSVELPDVEELAVLRAVLRPVVLARMPVEAAADVLAQLGEIIDAVISVRVRRQVEALESAAFIDPLTGIGNRRALERDLNRELARSQRHERPLSLVAIDLDGLKAINDTQGHAAGDDAIRQLASALLDVLRVGDGVYRIGGDEFVVLLPETSHDQVPLLLERAGRAAPSFSAGIATAPQDADTGPALVAVADDALLAGRRSRRSTLAEGTTSPEAHAEPAAGPAAPSVFEQRSPASAATQRLRFEKASFSTDEHRFTAVITLHAGDLVLVGRASGSAAGTAMRHTIAAATIEALSGIDPTLSMVHIDSVSPVPCGENEAIVVGLVLPTTSTDEIAIGAAAFRAQDMPHAVVRAVLDALNRRLARGGYEQSRLRGPHTPTLQG